MYLSLLLCSETKPFGVSNFDLSGRRDASGGKLFREKAWQKLSIKKSKNNRHIILSNRDDLSQGISSIVFRVYKNSLVNKQIRNYLQHDSSGI